MYHLCPVCEVETCGELLCPDCRTARAMAQDGATRQKPEAALTLSAQGMKAQRHSVWTWPRPGGEQSGGQTIRR